jgi:cytochrome P450
MASQTTTIAPPSAPARTPRMNGRRVAGEMLRHGLQPDGPIVRGVPGSDIASYKFRGRLVFTLRHPEYVDHVLHEAVDRYRKSIEYELLRAVLGISLFTDEGESWRRHRMMLNPLMAKRHVRGLHRLMSEPIERFTASLDERGDEFAVNMTYSMTELTLDVVGSALFGRGLAGFAQRMAPEVTTGLRAAERGTRLIMLANPPAWLARGNIWLLRNLPWVPRQLERPQRVMKIMDQSVWDVINERRDSGEDFHDEEDPDLLGLLLSARDERGKPLPLRRVRDEALTFMVAGHETTANGLSWMWYLLSRNHDARERLLTEVDEVLGAGPGPFSLEQFEALEWTAACAQEAMRVFPPAWVIPRVAVEDDEIDGHRIPKGATVIIPIQQLQNDPRFWPDPGRFDPTRFLPENAKRIHRSAYLPFGGGRRVCIGKSFALLEMTMIAALMSRHFTYEVAAGHRVEPEATLTMRPRFGLKMVARRRVRAGEAVA